MGVEEVGGRATVVVIRRNHLRQVQALTTVENLKVVRRKKEQSQNKATMMKKVLVTNRSHRLQKVIQKNLQRPRNESVQDHRAAVEADPTLVRRETILASRA